MTDTGVGENMAKTHVARQRNQPLDQKHNAIFAAMTTIEIVYTRAHTQVKAAFKSYLSVIIRRNNTITGLRYADDPAILSWEPMNEVCP